MVVMEMLSNNLYLFYMWSALRWSSITLGKVPESLEMN